MKEACHKRSETVGFLHREPKAVKFIETEQNRGLQGWGRRWERGSCWVAAQLQIHKMKAWLQPREHVQPCWVGVPSCALRSGQARRWAPYTSTLREKEKRPTSQDHGQPLTEAMAFCSIFRALEPSLLPVVQFFYLQRNCFAMITVRVSARSSYHAFWRGHAKGIHIPFMSDPLFLCH